MSFTNLFSTAVGASPLGSYLKMLKYGLVIFLAVFFIGTVYAGYKYVTNLQQANSDLKLAVAQKDQEINDLKKTASQNVATGKVNTEVVADLGDKHATADEDKAAIVTDRDQKVEAIKTKYRRAPRPANPVVPVVDPQKVAEDREISAVQISAVWEAYCKLGHVDKSQPDCQTDVAPTQPVQKVEWRMPGDFPLITSETAAPLNPKEQLATRAERADREFEQTLHYLNEEELS